MAGIQAILDVLLRAQALGFVGPGEPEVHLHQAEAMCRVAERIGRARRIWRSQPARVLDLGSGGGVPGLVVAWRWPSSEVVLLDSSRRRTEVLAAAVATLGWADRVRVLQARAEEAGRQDDWRGSFDLVVARSFASPPVTAECAAPFLTTGGLAVVSEPPARDDEATASRWPAPALRELGLEPVMRVVDGFTFQVLRQSRPCPERFPRRVGVPSKRPLYRIPS